MCLCRPDLPASHGRTREFFQQKLKRLMQALKQRARELGSVRRTPWRLLHRVSFLLRGLQFVDFREVARQAYSHIDTGVRDRRQLNLIAPSAEGTEEFITLRRVRKKLQSSWLWGTSGRTVRFKKGSYILTCSELRVSLRWRRTRHPPLETSQAKLRCRQAVADASGHIQTYCLCSSWFWNVPRQSHPQKYVS